MSPRTADYLAALNRKGDDFDYWRWLQQARREEDQAKWRPASIVAQAASEETDAPVRICRRPQTSPNGQLLNGPVPIPQGIHRLRRQPLRSRSGTPITRRLRDIRETWDKFQANRTRDAVYKYFEAVLATVKHYKVRRKTRKLLRHALEFADLPFDEKADPFSTVIRCTSDDNADNKTISKWARALRYVAHCKVPPAQLEQFMKEAGGSMRVPIGTRDFADAAKEKSRSHRKGRWGRDGDHARLVIV